MEATSERAAEGYRTLCVDADDCDVAEWLICAADDDVPPPPPPPPPVGADCVSAVVTKWPCS